MKISNKMLNPSQSNNKNINKSYMGLVNYSNESNASPYIVKRGILKEIPLFIVQF